MKPLLLLLALVSSTAFAQVPVQYNPAPAPQKQLETFDSFLGKFEGTLRFTGDGIKQAHKGLSDKGLKDKGMSVKGLVQTLKKVALPVRVEINRAISRRFVQIDTLMDPKGENVDFRMMITFDQKEDKLRTWFLQPTLDTDPLYEIDDNALEVAKDSVSVQNGEADDSRTTFVKTPSGLTLRMETKEGGVWVPMLEGVLHPVGK